MRKWFFIASVFILTSCEKDINFQLDDAAPLLVVDATIENDVAPTVVLTHSLAYFGDISPQILAASFVHDADVFISNGTVTHKLIERTYELGFGFKAYYYGIDSSSLSTAFAGEVNKQYNLRIVTGDQEYTATTMIPGFNAQLDSVWTKPAPQNPDSNKRILYVRGTDPPGRGNYVRYFTKVNSDPFFPGGNSVFDDQVIDGTTFDVQLLQGIDRNHPHTPEENFFTKGDTITMKFCNIDKATYTFWSTWEFAYQGIGNPFAQPNKVIGNVSNGALGAFCGYAARYRTVIAK